MKEIDVEYLSKELLMINEETISLTVVKIYAEKTRLENKIKRMREGFGQIIKLKNE